MADDLNAVNELLTKLLAGVKSQKQLNRLGLAAQQTIRFRTAKGVDVHGRKFKPYSDKWAEHREALGLPTHIVNLTIHDVEEGMMRRMDHIINNDLDKVEVKIMDPRKRKIADYLSRQGAGKNKVIREFWGLSDKEVAEITRDVLQADINDLLEDLADEISD